jgi:hypothetical protein
MRLFALAALLVMSLDPCLWADVGSYYVDPAHGNDSGNGSVAEPFKTIARAMEKVDGKGGEVHLRPDAGAYRQPIVIRKGGLPDRPLIIDGHGAVINLGVDVTNGPWTKTDDGYILERPLLPATSKVDTTRDPMVTLPVMQNPRVYLTSPVFVNGVPVFCDHAKGIKVVPRAAHGGYARYDERGRLVLVFPRGLTPKNSVIVLTGGPNFMGCCVQVQSVNNVILRNITAVFAANDGFNFHGSGKNVLVEHCTALFNSDEGMSAHDTFDLEVRDSEVAFNGTADGGITDIGHSTTRYKNMRVHQNRGQGFSMKGDKHLIENDVSFGNGGKNLPLPTDKIEVRGSQDLGPVAGDDTVPILPESQPKTRALTQSAETDRLARFLQFRPPPIEK